MIENSDRGITLNKSLAWTMASGFVFAGLWVGVQLTTLSTGIEQTQQQYTDLAGRLERRYRALEQRQSEDRQDIRAQSARLTAAQVQVERVDGRLSSIEEATRNTNENVVEILRYLRGTAPAPTLPRNSVTE